MNITGGGGGGADLMSALGGECILIHSIIYKHNAENISMPNTNLFNWPFRTRSTLIFRKK